MYLGGNRHWVLVPLIWYYCFGNVMVVLVEINEINMLVGI